MWQMRVTVAVASVIMFGSALSGCSDSNSTVTPKPAADAGAGNDDTGSTTPDVDAGSTDVAVTPDVPTPPDGGPDSGPEVTPGHG